METMKKTPLKTAKNGKITVNLFYNFNDRKAVDSEKIQAVSVGAFLTIQHAEVLAVETLNGIDYVTLDLNFDGLVKFIRSKQK